jgi:actin-like ATPase involved in cell morphogenesis
MQVLDKGKQDYYDALDELKQSFHKSIEIVNKLRDLGHKCGLSNEIIRKDIEQALQGIVKARQIRALLPLELKRGYKSNTNNKTAGAAELPKLHTKLSKTPTLSFVATVIVNAEKRKVSIPAKFRNDIDRYYVGAGKKVKVQISPL